jgi:hypothetical protein
VFGFLGQGNTQAGKSSSKKNEGKSAAPTNASKSPPKVKAAIKATIKAPRSTSPGAGVSDKVWESRHTSEKARLDTFKAKNREQMNALELKTQEAKQKLEGLNQQLAEQKTTLTTLKGDSNSLKQDIKHGENTLKTLQQSLLREEAVIKTLEQKKAKAQQDLEALNTQIEAQKNVLKTDMAQGASAGGSLWSKGINAVKAATGQSPDKTLTNFDRSKLPPGLLVGHNTFVPYSDYAATGERDAILASSGMGKSYLTGVLMEETLENKHLLCVIDPEGEHFTLAERYPMIIVGGEHAHLPMDDDAIELCIETMLNHGLSLVFDLSEFLDEEQTRWYAKIADALFVAEQQHRRKVRIVIEEAQIYAPQRSGGAAAKKNKQLDPVMVSQKLAKRGRKRAIDSLWATQRPASLNKDILSQCNRFWFGGITAELDYNAIKPFLTEAGISFAQIRALKPGQFYLYGKGKSQLVDVRKRHCRHAGATPEAGVTFQAVSHGGLNGVLDELQKAIASRGFKKHQEASEVAVLKQSIHELEEENRKLKKELQEEKLATRVYERMGRSSGMAPKKSRKTTDASHQEGTDHAEDAVGSGYAAQDAMADDKKLDLSQINTEATQKITLPVSDVSSG